MLNCALTEIVNNGYPPSALHIRCPNCGRMVFIEGVKKSDKPDALPGNWIVYVAHRIGNTHV